MLFFNLERERERKAAYSTTCQRLNKRYKQDVSEHIEKGGRRHTAEVITKSENLKPCKPVQGLTKNEYTKNITAQAFQRPQGKDPGRYKTKGPQPA